MPGSVKEGNGFAGKFSWTGYSGTFPGYPDFFGSAQGKGNRPAPFHVRRPRQGLMRALSGGYGLPFPRSDGKTGPPRRVRPSPPEERRENRTSIVSAALGKERPNFHGQIGFGTGPFRFRGSLPDRRAQESEGALPDGSLPEKCAGFIRSSCRQKYPPFRADSDSRNFPVSNLPRAFPPLPFPGAGSPGRAPFAKTPLIFQFPRDSCMILLGFSQNRSHFYSVKRRQTHCLKAEKIKSQWKSTAGNT